MKKLIYNQSKLLFDRSKREYKSPITKLESLDTLLGEILS